MNTNTVFRAIRKLVAQYQSRLAAFDHNDFAARPPMGGWSYSEVYFHIFDSNLLSLLAIQRAAKGDGEAKPTAFAAKAILFFGMLPPGKKYEAPQRLKERVKKISQLGAQQLITDFELQLAKTLPLLEKADPKIKVRHPRLGFLNAPQWLRFIQIHFKHHLKQIDRIDKSFRTFVKS